MEKLQDRKETLLKQIETANEPPPLLHPSMADLYRSKVEGARRGAPARRHTAGSV